MRRLWLSVLFVALSTPSAFAQPPVRRSARPAPARTVSPPPPPEPVARPIYRAESTDLYSAQVGLSVPLVGDIKDIASSGFQFGGEWIRMSGRQMGVGLGSNFAYYGSKSRDGVDYTLHQLSVLGLLRGNMSAAGPSTPYLIGGFGATFSTLDAEVGSAKATTSDAGSPTFMFGAGVDIPTASGMMFGLGLRYTQYFFRIGDESGGGTLHFLGEVKW